MPESLVTANQLLNGGWATGEGQVTVKKSATGSKTGNPNKLYNIPIIHAFRQLSHLRTEGEIGVEIECEGKNLFNAPIQYWSTHADHSLRSVDDHPPIEYVLKKPLSREKVTKALEYLDEKLKGSKSELHYSHRTSVHVHINCQQMTIKEIYQFICLYMIFEQLLVEFSGPDRVGNLFCLRAKDAQYFVHVLELSIKSLDFTELFSDMLRYTSCNTAAIGKFGSLEFRSMRGTVDKALIQQWIDILCLIRDKALEYESPAEIADDFMNSGAIPFFYKTFRSRPDIRDIWRGREGLSKTIWEDFRLMRDIAYSIEWEKAKKYEEPPISKKNDNEGLAAAPITGWTGLTESIWDTNLDPLSRPMFTISSWNHPDMMIPPRSHFILFGAPGEIVPQHAIYENVDTGERTFVW